MSMLWLTSAAAPIASPGTGTAWDDTAGAVVRLLGAAPSGASAVVTRAETSAVARTVLLGQWISEEMTQNAQLVAVDANFSLGIARQESDAAADMVARYAVWVCKPDGTPRAPVTTGLSGVEFLTAMTGRVQIPPGGLDVACQAGDRLIVEYGYYAQNLVTTSYSGSLRYGGTAGPVADGDTGTEVSTRSPWLQVPLGSVFEPLPTVEILRAAEGTHDPVLLGVDIAWGADIADPVSWVWVDITADVLVADGARVDMVHGRGDEAGETQPATCTMVLKNPDRRYSLGPDSPNFPNVRRNVPVRVRVQPDADPSVVDQFVGFADGFTPRWDSSGNHSVVALSASGTLRRLMQRQAPVMSSLRRAILTQVNAAGSPVVAYWPLEDGPGASLLTNLVQGGRPAAVSGTPTLGGNSAFLCSAPVVTMDKAIIRGTVPTAGNLTSAAMVRWLMDAAGNPSADVVVLRVATVGTITRWDVLWQTDGAMVVRGWSNAGALVVDQNAAFDTDDSTRRWQLELSTTGGTVSWRLSALEIGFQEGGSFAGTVSGTVTAISSVVIGPNADLEAGIGHVVTYRAILSLYEQAYQLNAYRGELAHIRLARLCTENSVPVVVVGASTVQMGPQSQSDLVTLLRECETADQGLLLDGKHAGLTYICGAERVNAPAAMTLDATAGELVGSVDPVDDDQRNTNKVTASRTSGAGVVFEDADGPLGTGAIGEYEDSITVNVSNDSDVLDYAGWAVHRGTRRGYRYPGTTLALHHNPELARQWAETQLASRVDLTEIAQVRTQFPEGDVTSLLEGTSQSFDQFTWDVSLVLSPYEPWRVGTVGGAGHSSDPEVMRLVSDGSTVATLANAGATSLSVATPSGPLWSTSADDVPFSIDLGEREVIVSAISGASSPQTFTVSALAAAVAAGTAIEMWRPPVLGVGGGGVLIPGALIGARSLRQLFPQVDYAPELSAFQTDEWSDVSGLLVQVESRSRYALEGYIAYDSAAAADISFAIMAPAGASGSWGMMPLRDTATAGVGDVFAARTLGINNAGDADAFRENAGGGGASGVMASVQGYMQTGPNDGVLQLRFAQVVTTASATQVRAGSWLRVTRLGDV